MNRQDDCPADEQFPDVEEGIFRFIVPERNGVVYECDEGEEGQNWGDGVDHGGSVEVGQLDQGEQTYYGVVEVYQPVEYLQFVDFEEVGQGL